MSEAPVEEELPDVPSIRNAGPKFSISRRFATVSTESVAEVGTLTVSSTPINEDTYRNMDVEGVNVGFQNYDFGEHFVSSEMIRDAIQAKSPDVGTMFATYGN